MNNKIKFIILPILLLSIMLSLCACSLIPGLSHRNASRTEETSKHDNTTYQNDSFKQDNSLLKVETLKSWSFQYNVGTSDYSLFFALCDSNGEFLDADVDVNIRIVNSEEETVYTASRSVTKKDFGYYTSQSAGAQYLANVRIPKSDISEGKSSNRTVYFTVYKGSIILFNEVNCSALYCLPVKDVSVQAETLPVKINIKGYDGSIESKIQIDSVTYKYNKSIIPTLTITITGTKTYGKSNSSYDIISYKLYDSENYMVKSGNIYLSSIGQGDKFKDDSIVIYDITPGENYTIKLMEYSR